MEFNWIQIMGYIFTVLMGALAVYFKHNEKIQKKAAQISEKREELRIKAERLITDAEYEFIGFKRGGERFEWIIDWLYLAVPDPLQNIFTREVLGDIVQGVYNNAKAFAKTQTDKLVDKIIADKEESDAAVDNAV